MVVGTVVDVFPSFFHLKYAVSQITKKGRGLNFFLEGLSVLAFSMEYQLFL